MLASLRLLAVALAIALNSQASVEIRNGSFTGCTPSQKNIDLHKPNFYPLYNDLTKTASGLPNEYANKIILRGIVVDKQCLPISDASIKIWQQDEYGDARYVKDETFSYKEYDMNYGMYREINGAGKTYSNNKGQFTFITVPPARYVSNKVDEYIRISISHKEDTAFETKIFLKKECLANKQFITASFNKTASAFYGVEVYDFTAVINTNTQHRRY